MAEAVREAVTREAGGLTARVMTAEHLMAIALQTGRAKDHARLVKFVEAGIAGMDRLRDILARHSLRDAWAPSPDRIWSRSCELTLTGPGRTRAASKAESKDHALSKNE